MAINPIQRFKAGDPRPGASRLNEMVDPINALRQQFGERQARFPEVVEREHVVTGKITSRIESIAGCYLGRIHAGDAALPADSESAALADESVGVLPGWDDVVVMNLADIDAGGHSLGEGDRFVGKLKNTHSPTTPDQYSGRMFVVVDKPGAAMVPVRVTVDGGSAGSDSTTCSFTYTITSLAGSQLGTAKTPLRHRFTNVEYNEPAADSYGQAFYDGTTLVLVEVFDEYPLDEPCEVPA